MTPGHTWQLALAMQTVPLSLSLSVCVCVCVCVHVRARAGACPHYIVLPLAPSRLRRAEIAMLLGIIRWATRLGAQNSLLPLI